MEDLSYAIDISAVLKQGVYLLSREGTVVYVGQSKCMLVRIYTHRALSNKRAPAWMQTRGVRFDKAEVIPCHPDRINELERGLIEFYQPVYNKTHNPNPVALPVPAFYRPKPVRANPFAGRRL